MNRDLACGVFMLALAVAYYLAAAAIPRSMLADAVGPGGLPEGYGVALGLFSLILIARALTGRAEPAAAGEARPEEEIKPEDAGHEFRRAGGLLVLGIVYIAILPWIGYPIAIALLVGAAILYQGGRPNLISAAVAVGAAALFWVIFVLVLQIPEPAGFWATIGL